MYIYQLMEQLKHYIHTAKLEDFFLVPKSELRSFVGFRLTGEGLRQAFGWEKGKERKKKDCRSVVLDGAVDSVAALFPSQQESSFHPL